MNQPDNRKEITTTAWCLKPWCLSLCALTLFLSLLMLLRHYHSHRNVIEAFPPQTEMQGRGITLISPEEKGWFAFDPKGNGAALMKAGQSKSECYAIVITNFRATNFKSEKDFLNQIKQMNTENPNRFKIRSTKEELNSLRGPYFANYYGLYEYYGIHSMPKGNNFALLEKMGFSALHPNDPGLIIRVEYSYRYYPGHEDPEFKKKAQWVLEHATFTKP
jgi:hypothetical protein